MSDHDSAIEAGLRLAAGGAESCSEDHPVWHAERVQTTGIEPARLSRRRLLRRAAGLGAAGVLVASGSASATEYEDRVDVRGLASMQAPSGALQPHATRVLWRPTTTDKVLALSFDDGPMEHLTRPLLEVLDRAKVAATFCVVGSRVVAQRDLVRRELSGRHELVNHSWSHPDLSQLNATAVHRELDQTDEAIERLTGQRPRFVRPPYGRLSGLALRCLAETHHDVLMWNVHLHDQHRSSADNVADVLQVLSPGTIVLGHDQGPSYRHVGLAAVPGIIAGAHARGYRFVTASELFALDTG